jgi:mono/diheme cytochrome c family protein
MSTPTCRALAVSLFAIAAAGALPARADDDNASAPMPGDLLNGAKRYRLDCASCHGMSGNGDGPLASELRPRPTRLRDGNFLWSHGDQQIIDAILGQGLPAGAPMHGRHITPLDARDIVAWLREPVLEVSAPFPLATDYIAHPQMIDRDGQGRIEDILGRRFNDAEANVMVFVVYRADPDSNVRPDGHPQKAAEDPASIYALKPRRRIGFVTYQTLDFDSGPIDALLAMDNDARLIEVRTMPSADPKVEKGREKMEKLLRTYIGTGGRLDKEPIEPHERGVKAPKDVQTQMVIAFERLLEGEAMFLKEERKRFELDPDAFNFPAAADQPTNVKFDFKQKKTK